jgi:hypothetical protein
MRYHGSDEDRQLRPNVSPMLLSAALTVAQLFSIDDTMARARYENISTADLAQQLEATEVEAGCWLQPPLERWHDANFSLSLGHIGQLAELFGVGNGKGTRCSGRFEQQPRI